MSDGLYSDEAWCEQLYKDKAAALILYGRALGLSHSEAEDVLQETFIALLKLTTPPLQPEYYCLRSFRNRALNYQRGLWRRLRREWEAINWFDSPENTCPEEIRAMHALAELPAPQREAIVLKIWHQHTFEEIGQILGISPNTIAGRYRLGLLKLQSTLKDAEYEELESFGRTTPEMAPPPSVNSA